MNALSVVVSENCSQHDDHETSTAVQLDAIPEDGQNSTGSRNVERAVCSKDRSCDNWVSDVICRSITAVECHGARGDDLGNDDNSNGLLPCKTVTLYCISLHSMQQASSRKSYNEGTACKRVSGRP